jgi:hypothetical protein
MRPRIPPGLTLMLCLLSASSLAAEVNLLTLQKNPFNRPEAVKAPPPPSPPPVVILPVLAPEEVRLDLTATMVSPTTPMVIVDGELLAIGDKIDGLKLIVVKEGSAVFTRAGKRYSFVIDDEERE